jgi:hypothetical protein
MQNGRTCRDEVLDAMMNLSRRHNREVFTPVEIIRQVQNQTDAYKESTIRTHVVSRMCTNAPIHHVPKYDDLVRVDRGLYRLR